MTLGKGRFPAAMEQCRERSEVSDRGRIFREVVKGQQLGPFEGPPILKPPALPGDSYYFGDRHKNGSVAIMPTGMHHPYVLSTPIGPCNRHEGQAGRLSYRQCVHVSAERNARARAASADQRRHHARHSDLLPHLVTQSAQVLRDERGSPDFLVAKLRVLVNVSSPSDHPCFDRGCSRIQPLVDWTRRSGHNVSCKRALWASPDQRAQAAGACTSDDVSTVEAVGRRCVGQERASCLLRRTKDGLHGTPHLRCIAVNRSRSHPTIPLRQERQLVGYSMTSLPEMREQRGCGKTTDFWESNPGQQLQF